MDISTVAVERAAVNAGAAGADIGGRIAWRQADLITWAPEPGRHDLAVMHFVHLPPGEREAAFRHLAAAVAPGGTLLIVAHHPSDLEIPGLRTAGPGFPPPGPGAVLHRRRDRRRDRCRRPGRPGAGGGSW